MNLPFLIVYAFHILIWFFVSLAFLHPKTAYINLFFIIPFIYISYSLLPECILVSMENKLTTNRKEHIDKIENKILILKICNKLKKYFKEHTKFSPMSPQGLLVFGAITSAYKLKGKFTIRKF